MPSCCLVEIDRRKHTTTFHNLNFKFWKWRQFSLGWGGGDRRNANSSSCQVLILTEIGKNFVDRFLAKLVKFRENLFDLSWVVTNGETDGQKTKEIRLCRQLLAANAFRNGRNAGCKKERKKFEKNVEGRTACFWASATRWSSESWDWHWAWRDRPARSHVSLRSCEIWWSVNMSFTLAR